MNAVQLQGRYDHFEIFTTGSGKDIVTIFVEVTGYGDKKTLIPIKGFGEVVTAAKALIPGRGILITGRVDSHESNGRWFPEVIADKVVHGVQTTSKKLGADPISPHTRPQDYPSRDENNSDCPF